MLNRVIIMGRITRDLELRQTPSGASALSFSVAVDRTTKNCEKQADFISCTAFGQRAEFIGRYFGKGRMIALEGSLKTGSYEKNGVTIYTTEVWVDNVSFTGEKVGDGDNNTAYYRQPVSEHDRQLVEQRRAAAQQEVSQKVETADKAPVLDDYEEIISDEGVPF